MVKQFRRFNQEYRNERIPITQEDQLEALSITGWTDRPPQSHPKETIIAAVYGGSDFGRKWQKFRVALQGLSTGMKLLKLQQRLRAASQITDPTERYFEDVRIDNYLRALKRGGILDDKLQIKK